MCCWQDHSPNSDIQFWQRNRQRILFFIVVELHTCCLCLYSWPHAQPIIPWWFVSLVVGYAYPLFHRSYTVLLDGTVSRWSLHIFFSRLFNWSTNEQLISKDLKKMRFWYPDDMTEIVMLMLDNECLDTNVADLSQDSCEIHCGKFILW